MSVSSIEINYKLNQLEEAIKAIRKVFAAFMDDKKYNRAQDSFFRIRMQISELRKSGRIVPKILVTSAIIYTNIIISKIGKYEFSYLDHRNKARQLGTFVRDNIDASNERLMIKYADARNKLLEHERIMEELFNESLPDVMCYAYFFDVHPLSKEDFLGLFSFNRDRVKDDCWRVNYVGSLESIHELPEIIDGTAFMQFAMTDSVLLTNPFYAWYFMVKNFKLLKANGLDIAEMLQEITGEPIQTFSSKVDEFGNVTEVKLNKPNLKLVK